MKSLTYIWIALSLICLVASSPISQSENIVATRQQQTLSLMEIIEAILNDPGFLSLNHEEQVHVLGIMYKMIQNQFLALLNINKITPSIEYQ